MQQKWFFKDEDETNPSEVFFQYEQKGYAYINIILNVKTIEIFVVSKKRLLIELDSMNSSNEFYIEPNIVIVDVFSETAIDELVELLTLNYLCNDSGLWNLVR